MVQALDDWNAQFGGEDFTQPSKSSGPIFQYKYNANYPVRVKRARLTTSSRGSRQLEIELSILGESGEEAGTRKEWLTLPKQPQSDLGQPPENVRKWTMRRRDDLGKVLAGADSHRYGLYSERRKLDDGKNLYIDHSGNPMSKEALDERGLFINRNIMECVDAMHDAISNGDSGDLDPVVGAEFYLVKVENTKNEKYPYTNFYVTPDAKLPMWFDVE